MFHSEDGSRKKAKTTEERNADESHTFSEDAPKLSDLAANGGTSADRPSDDNAMAVDDSKAPSKPNGPGGPDSDKQEDKQDLKSIEDEFTQLKEKFFSDKIAAVKAEIEQIELGTFLQPSPIHSSFLVPIFIFFSPLHP